MPPLDPCAGVFGSSIRSPTQVSRPPQIPTPNFPPSATPTPTSNTILSQSPASASPASPPAANQHPPPTRSSQSSPGPPYPTTAPSPQTYHSFPNLLHEIRNQVWVFSLSPRLVPIYYHSPTTNPRLSSRKLRGFTSPAEIPATLHVCKEARDAALRHYSLSFRVSGSVSLPSKIFFNPSLDILYFPCIVTPTGERRDAGCVGTNTSDNLASFQHFSNAIALIDKQELLKVRQLAVHESLFDGVPGNWNNAALREEHLKWFWWHVFTKFPNAVELTITGNEGAAIDEFPVDDAGAPFDASGSIGRGSEYLMERNIRGDGTDVDDEDGQFQNREAARGDRTEESLYDIALRTYWDLRKQEPDWVPPRWRVWKSTGLWNSPVRTYDEGGG